MNYAERLAKQFTAYKQVIENLSLKCYEELTLYELEQLANAYRATGQLSQLSDLDFVPRTSFSPTPYILQNEFLSKEQIQQVWGHVEKHQELFQNSIMLDDQVDSSYRKSKVLYEEALKSISPWFLNKVGQLLNNSWKSLSLEVEKIKHQEIQMTLHEQGAFFQMHQDASHCGTASNRYVTFVYYFYKEPKAFEGGDLILFDMDEGSKIPGTMYTRYQPRHNSIILFPSKAYHLVTPVNLPQKNPLNGRFTLNGWLHR